MTGKGLRRLVSALALSGAFLLLGSCMLTGFVRQSVYPAPPLRVPSPPPAPLEEVTLDVSTGERIVAWTHAAPSLSPGAPAVVFFHGNGENLETMRRSGLFEELGRLGVAWLAVDYPGYGRSSGEPSEKGLQATGDAAVAWIRKTHPGRPLVLCGWSLGAATAIGTASRHPDDVRGLIAMSPWTSLPDVARVHFPAFLVGGLMQESYDSVAAAKAVRMPSLVIHGERDDLIPVEHGRTVAGALSGSRWVSIPWAGHNDLLAGEEVWNEMDRFLKEIASAAGHQP